MGENKLSARAQCHLPGDYEATLFQPTATTGSSEGYIKVGRTSTCGDATVRALVELGARYGVELPICNTIYAILYEEADADAALRTLFTTV